MKLEGKRLHLLLALVGVVVIIALGIWYDTRSVVPRPDSEAAVLPAGVREAELERGVEEQHTRRAELQASHDRAAAHAVGLIAALKPFLTDCNGPLVELVEKVGTCQGQGDAVLVALVEYEDAFEELHMRRSEVLANPSLVDEETVQWMQAIGDPRYVEVADAIKEYVEAHKAYIAQIDHPLLYKSLSDFTAGEKAELDAHFKKVTALRNTLDQAYTDFIALMQQSQLLTSNSLDVDTTGDN